ncbi:MAG TPA: DUF4843 domain-containing protein [Butyricimonas virosa]|uniref:DUF4843 domain-containing protein n=1 Tax=Butyricimonas virosa TaxID=544645 RepID=A0A921H6I5_9BACT|nr:DUF4843 domain-containing protein [Butyricimonas virosa]
MNKIYVIFLVLVFFSCSEEKIMRYNPSENYIRFTNAYQDSVRVSFVNYPTENSFEVKLPVEITGNALASALDYEVVVDTDMSTGIENTHFSLERLTFGAGVFSDTLRVKLNRTADMKEDEFRIVLRLKDNVNFTVIPSDNDYAIVRVSDKISQPDWWDRGIVNNYLGVYSDDKYTLFIIVTNQTDLSEASPAEKRAYALQFKYWLEDQEKAGVTEYNGIKLADITDVPVKG